MESPNVQPFRRGPPIVAVALALLVSACGPAGAPPEPSDAHHHGSDGDGAPSRSPTAAEQAAADRLVRETRAAMAVSYADPAAARRDGYRQITPFVFNGMPVAHFLKPSTMTDGRELDPEHPESLIYLRTPDGGLTLIGVMFLTQRSGDPIGGPLTQWHTHRDLCRVPGGIVPPLFSGECPPDGAVLRTEMLHVWTVESPEDPFAAVLSREAAATAIGQPADHLIPEPVLRETDLPRVVSEILGLAPRLIRDRFEAGETLVDIAAAEGVSVDELLEGVTDSFDADIRRAQERDVVSQNLGDALRRWFTFQAPLLLESGPDDRPPVSVAGELGYPCEQITCLIAEE